MAAGQKQTTKAATTQTTTGTFTAKHGAWDDNTMVADGEMDIATARKMCADAGDIPNGALAVVNGVPMQDESYVIQPGDVVEFMSGNGQLG